MDTVFGIKWPIPTALDIGILFFVFFALLFLLLYAYNRFIIQNKKSQAFNLFLFKTRHLGLSSFKIKVLKSFIDSMALRNPINLLNRPKLFETAIIKFCKYLKKHNETSESISAIFREIISIYELLYHPFTYRKKLEKIHDIDRGQLVCIFLKDKCIYIGKVLGIEGNIKIKLLVTKRDIKNFKINSMIDIMFFRSGDAEYKFTSKIKGIKKQIIQVEIPQKTIRLKPVRLPDIPVEIECTLSLLKELSAHDKQETIKDDRIIKGTILKLNVDGAGISTDQKIDYDEKYYLYFKLLEFNIKAKCSILSEKKIRMSEYHYYNLKIEEMSEPAKDILNKYITDLY